MDADTFYHKITDRELQKDLYIGELLKDLQVDGHTIPKGTKVEIIGKYSGFRVRTFPCECCGIITSKARVPFKYLKIIEKRVKL